MEPNGRITLGNAWEVYLLDEMPAHCCDDCLNGGERDKGYIWCSAYGMVVNHGEQPYDKYCIYYEE